MQVINDDEGAIRIANEADRAAVAQILYKNGYAVVQARKKKGNKTFEQYVMFKRFDKAIDITEDVTEEIEVQ